jgi:hypothetical protein
MMDKAKMFYWRNNFKFFNLFQLVMGVRNPAAEGEFS